MSRPKANTEAGRIANEKWKQTMLARYGSKEGISEAMRRNGSKGGSVCHPATRVFSRSSVFASECGKKGGLISSRSADKASLNQRRSEYKKIDNRTIKLSDY